MSGTGSALAVGWVVRNGRAIREWYAMFGTDGAYAATRHDGGRRQVREVLRKSYAMSSTDFDYGPTRCLIHAWTIVLCDVRYWLRPSTHWGLPCYVVSGTDYGYPWNV
eukprot:3938883-Rhodomonas_salina.1